MTEIRYTFRIEGDADPAEALLDDSEIELIFAQTQADLGGGVLRKLGQLRCAEHDQAATVTIQGVYHRASDEMDVGYQVDACCQTFLMQVIQRLNNAP